MMLGEEAPIRSSHALLCGGGGAPMEVVLLNCYNFSTSNSSQQKGCETSFSCS